jgi:hypothetical protein
VKNAFLRNTGMVHTIPYPTPKRLSDKTDSGILSFTRALLGADKKDLHALKKNL